MKATLIKEKEGVYSLLDGNRFISTTECKEGTPNKLSIKNCEEIFNGYDLDKLAENTYREYPTDLKDSEYHYNRDYQVHKKRKAFIKGFNAAVEILGDKKFSEEDVKLAIEYGIQSVLQAVPGVTSAQSVLDSYKQSLQQTEWDVEILMGTQCRQIDCVDRAELVKSKIVKDGETPMLDKDSCLILKRI